MPIDYQAVKRTTEIKTITSTQKYNDHEKNYHHHPGSFIHRSHFIL